jgi:formylglycine-generating enzyme required for sulfatase activity
MNKKLIFSITLSIFFIAIILSGCFSHWQGDNAMFVISFAGAERSASSRDAGGEDNAVNVQDFEHRIELTRENEKIIFNSKGGTFEGYAPTGNWTIWVYSYLDGELFAAGSAEINLQVGQDNAISIKMLRGLIQGITTPKTGETPITEFENKQYTITVTWSPEISDTFASLTNYTATITLTAKDGYTLQGVVANFFTVAGGMATNEANSGIVTAVFPRTSIEMIEIAGGTFNMGKYLGNSEGDVENTLHDVTLTKFSMSKYQVTQEQYVAVMGSNPSHFNGGTGREPADGEKQGKRPVETVSWYDAIVFCNELSMMENLNPVYNISGSTNPAVWGEVPTSAEHANYATWNTVEMDKSKNGYRLPTEAQWEYAAKGGDQNAEGWQEFTYSGSDTAVDVAWYKGNSNSKTHEVGKKSPNRLGIYDMSGNVFEWCWDWGAAYENEVQSDPVGTTSGSVRVNRGGSSNYENVYLRSARRNSTSPYARNNGGGFRLVRYSE